MKSGGEDNLRVTTCFNCGRVGHRAAQRPTSVWEVEYEEVDGGHGDVESVSEGWDTCGPEKGLRLQRCQRWRGLPAAATAFACWVFYHSCTARSRTRRRRGPEDQTRPMDAAQLAGSDTQQSFGGAAGRGERAVDSAGCTGEKVKTSSNREIVVGR